VGIYPSGQAALRHSPDVQIVCERCIGDDVDLTILVPGAEREPFESIPNTQHPTNAPNTSRQGSKPSRAGSTQNNKQQNNSNNGGMEPKAVDNSRKAE
jgi:hypothetical protein